MLWRHALAEPPLGVQSESSPHVMHDVFSNYRSLTRRSGKHVMDVSRRYWGRCTFFTSSMPAMPISMSANE